MKVKPALKGLLSLVIAAACVYLGRVGALWLLAKLFQNVNLTAETYASAGKVLRFLADSADVLATIAGLLIAVAAGLFLKDWFPGEDKGMNGLAVLQLLLSFVSGCLMVRMLISADALREPLVRSYGTLDKWLLCLVLCAARSVILRGCCMKAAKESGGNIAAIIVSMILDGIFFLFVFGEGKDILSAVNGVLAGAALGCVYLLTNSLASEIIISFGFTAGHRFIGGFGEGGIYSVGEGILTGSGRGIECSLTLTIAFAVIAALVVFVYLYGKNHHGRKKTAVHR